MDKFFEKCGLLVSTAQRREGAFPAVRCIVRFTYQHGWSEFDGKSWTYHID